MNITRSEILERLRAEADQVVSAVPHVRMFVFGSLLRTEAWPSDVDVLVVYENPPDVVRVRALLEPLYSEMPLHVLFLSRSEEAQLQFVASENCVPLR
jgi:predicted nucleotidyltransferase